MSDKDKDKDKEERKETLLPVFRLIKSLFGEEKNVEIEFPKLLIHASPLEVMTARDTWELYAKMLGLGDYIVDALSSFLYDEELAAEKLHDAGFKPEELKKLVTDYQTWLGEQKRCEPVRYECNITGTGDNAKITWSSPDSKVKIQCTEATAAIGLSALERSMYSTLICEARSVFCGARRLAFRIGVCGLDDSFTYDSRKYKPESISAKVRDAEELEGY